MRRVAAWIAMLTTLLGLLPAAPLFHPLYAQTSADPPRVYLLTGRDAGSDTEALAALREAGYRVERGVETTSFDGSQADLAAYDVVVVLNHANWAAPVPLAGLAALRAYIEDGGAVLFGEWFVWKGLLGDLLPVESCGFNQAETTVYTSTRPNPAVNDGVPSSFRFPLSRFAGSEGCLRPRPEATVLYRSSNGGGTPGSAGVAAWNVQEGRVAAVSNLLARRELADQHLRRLFQNLVGWLAQRHDLSAPVLERLTISETGSLTGNRLIRISTTARDTGGSGLGALYLVEYTLTGGARPRFRQVARSGWVDYALAARDYQWKLTDEPGLHYLQVWVADRAGNVSAEPMADYVSYFDGSASIARSERVVYRIRPPALSQVAVKMTTLNGDPDLYVYDAAGRKVSEDLFTAASETASFIADGSTYQIEIEGMSAGIYHLEISDRLLVSRGISTPGLDRVPVIDPNRGPPVSAASLPPAPMNSPVDLYVPMVEH